MKKLFSLAILLCGITFTSNAKSFVLANPSIGSSLKKSHSFTKAIKAKSDYELHMAIFDTCGCTHVVLWETVAELSKFIDDALIADCG